MKTIVPKEKINKEIKANEVRVIGQSNEQIGIVSLQKALQLAESVDLDLVEISPNSEPPVCKITDFSKYYYEKVRKSRETKKKQHVVQVKEVKFGPNTDEHDYNFKKNNAVRFLKQHNKVKLTVRFRGRQLAHKDLGYKVLERLENELAEFSEVDQKITSEKNLLSMVIAPKKDLHRISQNAESNEGVDITIVNNNDDES